MDRRYILITWRFMVDGSKKRQLEADSEPLVATINRKTKDIVSCEMIKTRSTQGKNFLSLSPS